MRTHILRNSRAVVADLDYNAVSSPYVRDSKLAFPPIASMALSMILCPYLVSSLPKKNSQGEEYAGSRAAQHSCFIYGSGSLRLFPALYDVDVLHRSLIHVGVFLIARDKSKSARCCSRFHATDLRPPRSSDFDQSGRAVSHLSSRTRIPVPPAEYSFAPGWRPSCHKSFCPRLRSKESIGPPNR